MTHARNIAVGAYGEDVAARHLVSLGLAILDRNWTCRYGEIDIVVRDADTLVVCEVKTRTSTTHGTAVEAVTPRKATRLRRLAAHWLQVHELQPAGVRIDVVTVQVPPRGPAQVQRICGVA